MIPLPDPRLIFNRDLMRSGFSVYNRCNAPPRSVSIDWTHPLAQGLASFVIDPSCDLVNNRRMLHRGIHTTWRGIHFENNNSELKYFPLHMGDAFTATMILPWFPNVSSNSVKTLWTFGRNSTRIYGEVFARFNGSSLKVSFWNGRYIQEISDDHSLFNRGFKGAVVCIVVRFDPSQAMGGTSSGYKLPTAGPDGGTPHLDIATIGCDVRDHKTIGDFTSFILHNRYLNDAELHQMSRNPYQMLRRTW